MAEVSLVVSDHPLETAADLLAGALSVHPERSRGTPSRGRRPRLGIPGGSAAAVLALARAVVSPDLWRSLRLTWVDERVVPQSDPASNRGELLRGGALEVGQELPLVLDGESPQAAVARVTDAFTRDFEGELDVALLGMGEDGHIASLFPGHALLDTTALVGAVTDSPKPPRNRVTLTLPVLARPGVERIIVAMGEGKRDALRRLVEGDRTIPARRLGPVTVVTDQQLT